MNRIVDVLIPCYRASVLSGMAEKEQLPMSPEERQKLLDEVKQKGVLSDHERRTLVDKLDADFDQFLSQQIKNSSKKDEAHTPATDEDIDRLAEVRHRQTLTSCKPEHFPGFLRIGLFASRSFTKTSLFEQCKGHWRSCKPIQNVVSPCQSIPHVSHPY